MCAADLSHKKSAGRSPGFGGIFLAVAISFVVVLPSRAGADRRRTARELPLLLEMLALAVKVGVMSFECGPIFQLTRRRACPPKPRL
jgi:hypothetical protein